MSVVPPPSENLPIFNPDVFELDDSNISLSQADARYYKKTGGVISGSATIAGTTNLLSTTNISGVVNISNSTQSTASTNGALVVSGGLGIARNSHFGGTVHVPVGSVGAPSFSFVSDPNTGIFQNGADVLGISANGSLRVSHSATTSTINNILSLPTTGSASAASINFGTANTGFYQSGTNTIGITANGSLRITHSPTTSTINNIVSLPTTGSVSAPSINFGTANTGIFSSSSGSLNFTIAGSQRLDMTGSRASFSTAIQMISGAQNTPSIYFSTSTSTGFYLPASNQLGITVSGTLRQTIDATRMITNIPIRLPNDGINFSDFGYYEVFSQTMIIRYSASATFNLVVNVVRIGQNITYHVGSDATLYTINNGPRNLQSETNTFPTRLRPGVNSVFPYAYLTGGLAWTSGKIIFNSDGSMSISPLNAQFNTGDSIYIQQFSATVYI